MDNTPIIKIVVDKDGIIPGEFRQDLPSKPAWTEPKYERRQELEGCSYLEPGGWKRREAAKPKGFYYYPYQDANDGMLYFCYSPNPDKTSGLAFPFHVVVMGFVADDEDKIRSETEVMISGIRGRKANFLRDLGEVCMEMDVYILPKDEFVYMIMFGERDYIRPEMKQCEQTIMESFLFK